MKVFVPSRRQPPSGPHRPRPHRHHVGARLGLGHRQAADQRSRRSAPAASAPSARRSRGGRSVPTTMSAWWRTVAAVERQAAASSSPTMQSSASPSPAPPYSAGAWRRAGPARPPGPALRGEALGGVERLRPRARRRAGRTRGRCPQQAPARARGRGRRPAAGQRHGLSALRSGVRGARGRRARPRAGRSRRAARRAGLRPAGWRRRSAGCRRGAGFRQIAWAASGATLAIFAASSRARSSTCSGSTT